MDHRDGSANRAVREWRDAGVTGQRPSTTTQIMTCVRLGLGRAVPGMVIVELLMVSGGFGGLILEYRSRFEAPGSTRRS